MENIKIQIKEVASLVVAVGFIAAVSIFIWNVLSWIQFIELVKVLAWPVVVVLALLFFKKVFTYLFFSMEEFDFFGAKGGLKNVRDMVREKADELYEQEMEGRKRAEERAAHQKELSELKTSTTEGTELSRKAIAIAEKTFDENQKYRKENADLKRQNESLLAQIAGLQYQFGERHPAELPIEIEETRDVGEVNPESQSSKEQSI